MSDRDHPKTTNPPRPRVRKQAENAPAIVASRSLLGTAKRLLIEHQGEHYELRETRRGRLILTK